MPSSMLGFIEMALIFGLALGWGVFELLSLRRGAKRPAPAKEDAPAPEDPRHLS